MMIGHEKIIHYFDRLIQKDTLAHAYAFCGPHAVGKKTVALLLAQNIFCLDAHAPRHERSLCSRCKAITEGTYYNVIVVEPRHEEGKKHIAIAQIRSLRNKLRLKEAEGKKRIVIVEGAEYMNSEAANAFLKTLEEPFPNIHFFLITKEMSALLPTIASRVQAVRFFAVQNGKIEKALIALGVPAKRAREYGMLSFGRPGIALEFMRNPQRYAHAQETLKISKYINSDFITERLRSALIISSNAEEAENQVQSWLLNLETILQDQVAQGDVRAYATAGTLRQLLEAAALMKTTTVNPRLTIEKIIFGR